MKLPVKCTAITLATITTYPNGHSNPKTEDVYNVTFSYREKDTSGFTLYGLPVGSFEIGREYELKIK